MELACRNGMLGERERGGGGKYTLRQELGWEVEKALVVEASNFCVRSTIHTIVEGV
jgi:hypothetical protein